MFDLGDGGNSVEASRLGFVSGHDFSRAAKTRPRGWALAPVTAGSRG
jgi:hypothetical protein